MNKTTKILLIVVVVVAIGAAVFLMWPKKKPGPAAAAGVDNPNDFTTNNNVTGGNGSGGGITSSPPPVATPPYNAQQAALGGVLGGLFSGLPNLGNVLLSGSGGGNSPTGQLIGQGTSGAGAVANAVFMAVSGKFPLKQGSSGNEVKVIQTAANQSIDKGMIRASKLVVDGIWGPKTTAAVSQVFPGAQISYEQYTAIQARVAMKAGLK